MTEPTNTAIDTTYRLYLVDVKTGRVLASSEDQNLCDDVKQNGEAIDPTGERNIRISFAYGRELW